jgi:hypothetical protein
MQSRKNHLQKSQAISYLNNKDEAIRYKKKIFESTLKMSQNVSCYSLRVNLTGRIWENIESILKNT